MNMITKMRFVSITVTDIDQALDFYIGKLGFRVVRQMPMPGGNQFVLVQPPDGGAHLAFSLPIGRPHVPTSAISFETDDIQLTQSELITKGVQFTRSPAQTPWGGWEAVFVDPFGNSFMLHQGGL
jgi:catechol 2,3-dioxygenase-like lactoylglutathione lyase family enzyme